MTARKQLTRLVTCQGGIQLIAAVAALTCREREQSNAGHSHEYRDLLVIYDLYAPHGQLAGFASVVKKMAIAIRDWENIVYLDREQMDGLGSNLTTSEKAVVFNRVHELVGRNAVDEIYLCRNWQLGNLLMLNAYRDARKICYGDAIGIYFSEAYFSPRVDGHKTLRSLIGRTLRKVKNTIRAQPGLAPSTQVIKTLSPLDVLEQLDFDVGYFLLPNILGEEPPMRTRPVPKEITTKVFRKLAEAFSAESMAVDYRYISHGPTVVLMTSNFSEAARMAPDNELTAYREFLKQLKFPRETRLVIKPHPRDSENKIHKLGQSLSDLFAEVVLLTEPHLFFVPFEVFLMQTFRGESSKALHDLEIVTFSTACISLEVLFDLQPIIGFGNKLVRKFFFPAYVSGRIKHEADLKLALLKTAETLN